MMLIKYPVLVGHSFHRFQKSDFFIKPNGSGLNSGPGRDLFYIIACVDQSFHPPVFKQKSVKCSNSWLWFTYHASQSGGKTARVGLNSASAESLYHTSQWKGTFFGVHLVHRCPVFWERCCRTDVCMFQQRHLLSVASWKIGVAGFCQPEDGSGWRSTEQKSDLSY